MPQTKTLLTRTYLRTTQGVRQLETEANEMHDRGYDLLTVVPLDKSMAAIYKLVREPDATADADVFGLEDWR